MKILQSKIMGPKLVFLPILIVNQVSSYLSFFLSASTAATYRFTTPTCTTTLIILEHCALNAEFQHFILRFNKNFFTLQIALKEGIGGESRLKDMVTLWITLLPHTLHNRMVYQKIKI
jgi:hypothetical protein